MNKNLWNIFDDVRTELEEVSYSHSGSHSDSHTDNHKDKSVSTGRVCNACSSNRLIEEDGMIVCADCGVEGGLYIDYQQEWRYYGNDDTKHGIDPTRCGNPVNPLLPNASMTTTVQGKGKEKWRDIIKWGSMNYIERSRLQVFKQIQNKCQENSLPDCIINRAKIMYSLISSDTLKRGKTRKGLIAACISYSCKDKNINKTIGDISKMFDLNPKKVADGCKHFQEIMFLNDKEYTSNIQPTTPEGFIETYATNLGIQTEYKNKAIYVAKMSGLLGLVSDSTPPSIAVGSIFMITNYFKLGITRKKIAEVCEVSEVTIAKSFKKIEPLQKYLIPK